jgi:hypothetical protein
MASESDKAKKAYKEAKKAEKKAHDEYKKTIHEQHYTPKEDAEQKDSGGLFGFSGTDHHHHKKRDPHVKNFLGF